MGSSHVGIQVVVGDEKHNIKRKSILWVRADALNVGS